MPSTMATPFMPMPGNGQAGRWASPTLGSGVVGATSLPPGPVPWSGWWYRGWTGGGAVVVVGPSFLLELLAELVLGVVLVERRSPQLVGHEGEEEHADGDKGQRRRASAPGAPSRDYQCTTCTLALTRRQHRHFPVVVTPSHRSTTQPRRFEAGRGPSHQGFHQS